MEFLPLCDNLFNVISLAGYFCDVVFDIVLGYALFERGKIHLLVAVILIISGSLIVSQIVSLKWYLKSKKSDNAITNTNPDSLEVVPAVPLSKISKYSVIALHCSQMGVLWRYAKLFVPLDLRYVKHDVRDLCILRLIHAFCEAAPMLLIQSYILITLQANDDSNLNTIKIKTLGGQLSTHLVQQSTIVHQYQQKTFKDLNTISASLSLFSVAWALASFSKNVRHHNVHRLVLTWLGVIFQFLWRLGTVISRVLSLTVYASVYGQWIFLVIILHWISMFLWLISPKNAFHGERISKLKKVMLSGLIAFIYIFAYINLQDGNHKQKILGFYVVMFLENCLLVSLWMVGIWPDRAEDWYMIPLFVFFSFVIGICLMLLYYKYFHIRRLGYEAEAEVNGKLNKGSFPNVCRCKNPICNGNSAIDSKYSNMFPDPQFHQKKDRGFYGDANGCDGDKNEYPSESKMRSNIPTNEHLKGIFNCRFTNPVNNATKRKKKKPTTFVPPPVLSGLSSINNGVNINVNTTLENGQTMQQQLNTSCNGPMSIPFWRRPLPRNSLAGGSSENEGSVGSSRINIQLKLQEKKQKQLAELKIIEEEIKQGKLGRPNKLSVLDQCDNEEGKMSLLPRQPIPRVKKHIDIESIELRRSSSSSETECQNINILMHHHQQQQQPHSKNESPNIMYNNFSSNNGGIAAALTKFSHEILTNINIGDKGSKGSNSNNMQQPSASSTMTSTTSENDNMSSRKKLLHHNLGNNLNNNGRQQITASPSCHFDPRPGPYSSLEGKNKNDTNRSSNSKNDNNSNPSNNNSMEKDKSLMASQLIKRQMKRANTPEILLAPNHLDNNTHYYLEMVNGTPSITRSGAMCDASNNYMSDFRNNNSGNGYERTIDMNDCDRDMNSQNIPSDIDSQMSLPRSYTLPREFKFNRRYDGRKMIKNEHFIASTNSSDGDVDSCDDNEFEEDDDDEHMHRGKGPVNHQRNMRNFNRRTNNLNKSNYMNKNLLHSSNNAFNNLNQNIIEAQNKYQHPQTNITSYQNNMRVHLMGAGTSSSGHNGNIKVNNLDLLNGCMVDNGFDMDSQHNGSAPGNSAVGNNRQNRLRMYGQNVYNRHETKL